jgi:phage-related protein
MTSPGAVERARVGVRVLPDTSVFARSLERYLQRVERTLRIELPVVLDDKDVDTTIQSIRERVEGARPVKVPAELDTDGVAQQREKIRKDVETGEPAKVPVTAENPLDARFRAEMQAELKRLTGQLSLQIPASPDAAELRRKLGVEIAELEKQLQIQVPVEPDEAADFRAKIRAQIASVQATLPAIKPDLEPELDERDVLTLRARIAEIARRLSGANIRFDVGINRDSIARLTTQVLALGASLSALGLGALAGSAATGAIAALASEIAQTAGVLALIPAVGFAAAAGLGAVIVGFQGVGKAIKASGDPTKFAEALKKLSPEARQTAVAVKELGDEFQDLRLSVQDSLFDGIAESVKELGERLLPTMKRGLTEVAAELNAGTREWAAFAASPRAVADLDTTFANITAAFHNLVPAGADFAAALSDIATVGSGFLPELGQGLADAGTQFRNFIAESRKSGELEAFIQRALDALSQLGRIIGNVAAAFGNIFAAGQERGATLLTIIEQITQEFQDFTGSARGQQAIGDFFQAASKAAEALIPVLESLFELFSSSILPILADIGTVVGPAVATVFDAIGQALKAAQPGILAFAQGFASFLQALAPALPAIGQLVSVLGTSLGTILERLGPTIANVATVLAGALADALSNPALIDGLVSMGEAFAEILTALAPSLPKLAELAGIVLKGLAQVLERIAPVLGDLVSQFLDALLPVMPDLVSAFVDLADAFAPIAGDLGEAFVAIFKALAPILPPLVTLFAAMLKILQPFVDLLAIVIKAIADAVGWLVDLADAGITALNILNGQVGGVQKEMEKTSGKVVELGDATEGSFGRIGKAAESGSASLQKAAADGGFWMGSLAASAESSSQRIQTAQANFLTQLEKTLIPAFGRMRDTGSASFWDIANAAAGAADATVNQTRRLAEQARAELAKVSFADQGARLTKSLADGLVSSVALSAVRAAASRMISEISAYLPRSPAKVGPFSGKGWTPYRGQALAEGFATGMLDRVAAVRAAAGQLAEAANANLGIALTDGTGSGAGMTFNVYGVPGQSEESLAHKTSRVVAWETKKSVPA